MSLRVRDISSVDFAPGLRLRIAAYIAAVGPDKHISWAELADLCWGRAADGGPEKWREQLGVHVCHIRRSLYPGWIIERAYMGGIVLRRVDAGRKAA